MSYFIYCNVGGMRRNKIRGRIVMGSLFRSSCANLRLNERGSSEYISLPSDKVKYALLRIFTSGSTHDIGLLLVVCFDCFVSLTKLWYMFKCYREKFRAVMYCWEWNWFTGLIQYIEYPFLKVTDLKVKIF